MQLRRLGRTDLMIAPMVLGGNVFGWTADEANGSWLVYDLDSDPGVRDRSYVIRVVGGRVESFGRFSELADLYRTARRTPAGT